MNNRIVAGEELLHEVMERMSRENMEYDAHQKRLFKYRAVLAVILHLTTEEFGDIPPEEIIPYIEADTISDNTSVAEGETVRQENAESKPIGEKTLFFDLLFWVTNPKSGEKIGCRFMIDYEVQKSLKLSYPIENRGVYYLARMISSQLNYVFEDSKDYQGLKKAFSIWVCVNDIKRGEENSVVRYRFEGKQLAGMPFRVPSADFMELMIIKLGGNGDEVGPGREDAILRFLYGIFTYGLHKNYFEEFINTDRVENGTEIKEEVEHMGGGSMLLVKEALERGIRDGIERGRELGSEQAHKDSVRKLAEHYRKNDETLSEEAAIEMAERILQ